MTPEYSDARVKNDSLYLIRSICAFYVLEFLPMSSPGRILVHELLSSEMRRIQFDSISCAREVGRVNAILSRRARTWAADCLPGLDTELEGIRDSGSEKFYLLLWTMGQIYIFALNSKIRYFAFSNSQYRMYDLRR